MSDVSKVLYHELVLQLQGVNFLNHKIVENRKLVIGLRNTNFSQFFFAELQTQIPAKHQNHFVILVFMHVILFKYRHRQNSNSLSDFTPDASGRFTPRVFSALDIAP
jgi:hypothetical protein